MQLYNKIRTLFASLALLLWACYYNYTTPHIRKLTSLVRPSPPPSPALCYHGDGTLDGSNRSKLAFAAPLVVFTLCLIVVRLAGASLMSLHFSANQVRFLPKIIHQTVAILEYCSGRT